jgi:plastocyanin
MSSIGMKWLSVLTVSLLFMLTAACGGSNEPLAVPPSSPPTESAAASASPSPAAAPTAAMSATPENSSPSPSAEDSASPSPTKSPEPSKDDHGSHSKDDKPSSKPAESSKPSKTPSPSPSPSKQTEDHVRIEFQNFAFSPAEIQITPGTKVEFINRDKVKHSATADGGEFDTGLLGQDESKTVTFDKEGTFAYHCDPHQAMTGKIVVKSK